MVKEVLRRDGWVRKRLAELFDGGLHDLERYRISMQDIGRDAVKESISDMVSAVEKLSRRLDPGRIMPRCAPRRAVACPVRRMPIRSGSGGSGAGEKTGVRYGSSVSRSDVQVRSF